jgi:hypothetical protein
MAFCPFVRTGSPHPLIRKAVGRGPNSDEGTDTLVLFFMYTIQYNPGIIPLRGVERLRDPGREKAIGAVSAEGVEGEGARTHEDDSKKLEASPFIPFTDGVEKWPISSFVCCFC